MLAKAKRQSWPKTETGCMLSLIIAGTANKDHLNPTALVASSTRSSPAGPWGILSKATGASTKTAPGSHQLIGFLVKKMQIDWEDRRRVDGCCVRCQRHLSQCRCNATQLRLSLCLSVCRKCHQWGTDRHGRTGCLLHPVPCKIADRIINGGDCLDVDKKFTQQTSSSTGESPSL